MFEAVSLAGPWIFGGILVIGTLCWCLGLTE